MGRTSKHPKLGEFLATAICGNDILSSSLYVSGIAAIFAGIYAPLVLLIVAGVLYLYKKVYTEVVEALPINGGAYNCLLNGTRKTVAAIAGVMTLLSYVATAVISAKTGVAYLSTIIHLPVIPVTIALMALFSLLVISGLKDSAKVASVIFVVHLITLTVFIVFCFSQFALGHTFFTYNIEFTPHLLQSNGGFVSALYLAFAASLLGVSGFESSANFVEEQQPGVFRKTLKNMLAGVAIFNPLIALAVLAVLPLPIIAESKDFVLAQAAVSVGGQPFLYLIALDAFAVLSGALLTAFVGVSGLVSRMALDNCLPASLAITNRRGGYPRIVILFFVLCTSILLITRGNLLSLAGVYTISFLGVMSAFALGNLILKSSRPDLKRTYRASYPVVIAAFAATVLGILGNIRVDEQNLNFFEIYFIPALILVLAVIYQDAILRFLIAGTSHLPTIHSFLKRRFEKVVEGGFVVFVHKPDRLFPILSYVVRNEVGRNITLICCKSPVGRTGNEPYKEISKIIPELKMAGVFPQLNVNLLYRNETFGPKIIDEVSHELHVPKNHIFMGAVRREHPFNYEDLGGVRIIH